MWRTWTWSQTHTAPSRSFTPQVSSPFCSNCKIHLESSYFCLQAALSPARGTFLPPPWTPSQPPPLVSYLHSSQLKPVNPESPTSYIVFYMCRE